ncbi:MAG: hypothetical protein EPN70_00550 [Paraburkholderia sp.]|uniref:hypothetical protein n=1 Tax=Paraburkholderia sp. TaxID=1926495 RepID=UPI00120317E2|nr:hypothetical protein [Paraburkholderia sp.]TAM08373.1 MAG: hypothetical protein EPN70_00550 [Paraburkholderia sp.]
MRNIEISHEKSDQECDVNRGMYSLCDRGHDDALLVVTRRVSAARAQDRPMAQWQRMSDSA